MDTLNLEFGGTEIFRDENKFGDYTFVFTITDTKGGETEIRQSIKIKDAIAPTFASTPSSSFDIMQRTPFSYTFPQITEGDLTPAKATIEVTSGLDSSLLVTQSLDGSNQIVI